MKYLKLEELFALMGDPVAFACRRMYLDNKGIIDRARGSRSKHQAWEGGYVHHIEEAMNLGVQLFYLLTRTRRELPFSLTDVLFVLWLHDIEKPFKQVEKKFADGETRHRFRMNIAARYGIIMSSMRENALRHVEGETPTTYGDERAMGPLAAFVHACDTMSARMWFGYPTASDPWKYPHVKPKKKWAGIILWRKGKKGIEILIISGKRIQGYAIPGGKIEHGETKKQAAIRETGEEAGYVVEKSSLHLVGKRFRRGLGEYTFYMGEVAGVCAATENRQARWIPVGQYADWLIPFYHWPVKNLLTKIIKRSVSDDNPR